MRSVWGITDIKKETSHQRPLTPNLTAPTVDHEEMIRLTGRAALQRRPLYPGSTHAWHWMQIMLVQIPAADFSHASTV